MKPRFPADGLPVPAVILFPDAAGPRETFRVVADRLAGDGYTVLLPDVHHRWGEWRPFDAATVLAELNTDRLAVTLENHSVVGGLFETVASAVVIAGLGKRVVPVALPDEFLDAGALPTLHERYGLSVQRIVAKVLAELG